MSKRVYWLHALSPLHVGVGRGIGFIDLPIMREKLTTWPVVPGSGVKGVLADHFEATVNQRDSVLKRAAFGTGGDENPNAGALVFADARIVCLPVRSLYGTFAWTTSQLALKRLLRDLGEAGVSGDLVAPPNPDDGKVRLPEGGTSVLADNGSSVFFEDLDFASEPCAATEAWAYRLAGWVFPDSTDWQEVFRARFVVVPENTFSFLCETATEVNARVKIDERQKTVAQGALWYEEALPAETILAGLVWCDRPLPGVTEAEILGAFCPATPLSLQMGGKATVGRGRVDCVFLGGD